MKELSEFRKSYNFSTLSKAELPSDPLSVFTAWFSDAVECKEIDEPNAFSLSTVSLEGIPNSRMLLLKEFDDKGFVFFTNYSSSKSKEISENNKVSLLFYWPALERQIRIQGEAFKVTKEESQEYFNKRPKGSQISALVSKQSLELENRKILESAYEKKNKELINAKQIKCPDTWGGFVVKPFSFEFWQGRENRLHDRIRYSYTLMDHVDLDKISLNNWRKVRLYP